ncbi:MAG: cytochrome c biogenesis CcdA family protein [Actinomycetota bacterium]
MGAITIALVAGGLSTVNPCGFALLPAFLSFYVGADEDRLPSAPTRMLQALMVGALVSAGFLTVFISLAIPLSYGAARLTGAIPWAGMVIGVALVIAGGMLLAGSHLSVSFPNPVRVKRDRRLRTMYLFGIGYGIASLGCTLPVFLAVVGASLSSGETLTAVGVVTAYGAGMSIIMMALSMGAGLLRQGLASNLKRLVPHMHRISGGLLIVTGVYLAYYWIRVRFGSMLTLSSDPLIGTIERFSATVQRAAASGTGRWILPIAVVAIGGVLIGAFARARSSRTNGTSERYDDDADGGNDGTETARHADHVHP